MTKYFVTAVFKGSCGTISLYPIVRVFDDPDKADKCAKLLATRHNCDGVALYGGCSYEDITLWSSTHGVRYFMPPSEVVKTLIK